MFSSNGEMSRQLDVIIYDDLFSVSLPLRSTLLVSHESVYGSIEVKSLLTTERLRESLENIESLKKLHREPTDVVDVTPHYRLNLDNSTFSYDKVTRNPVVSIVFALDGLTQESALRTLLKRGGKRQLLPDFVFNLERGYVISRWRGTDEGRKTVDCMMEPEAYGGFIGLNVQETMCCQYCGLR